MGATVGLGAGNLLAKLEVGSPVGVLPWGVLVIAPFWPLGTQPPLAMLALTDTIVWWPIVISQLTQKKSCICQLQLLSQWPRAHTSKDVTKHESALILQNSYFSIWNFIHTLNHGAKKKLQTSFAKRIDNNVKTLMLLHFKFYVFLFAVPKFIRMPPSKMKCQLD